MKDYVETFEHSLARAVGGGEYNHAFIERFYEIFTARSVDIAALFRDTDMSAQRAMLHDSLLYLVDFFKTRKINPFLARIAKVHGRAGLDIPDSMYDIWLDCLLDAVREFDTEFDDDVELAWRLVLAPGVAYMKFMRKRGIEKSAATQSA